MRPYIHNFRFVLALSQLCLSLVRQMDRPPPPNTRLARYREGETPIYFANVALSVAKDLISQVRSPTTEYFFNLSKIWA